MWQNPNDPDPSDTRFPSAPQSERTSSEPVNSSFYSPRNDSNLPPIPPTSYNTPNFGASPNPPPPHSSHKGLRIVAICAGLVFLSVASIQCYRFLNDSLQDNSSQMPEESTTQLGSANSSADVNSQTDTDINTDSSAFVPDSTVSDAQEWITLATPEGGMSLPDIVDKVMPAAVGVASTFVYEQSVMTMWGIQTQEKSVPATGTGIIMSEDGYIITNAHVIYSSSYNGLAQEIQIVLNTDYYAGDTQIVAKVIGYDTEEDIAVLKVDTNQKLTAAEFGNSDNLRVGELVVAIGNPLGFELFGSVTTGIVSALNREVTINESTMRLIQTDTAINAGNSGGPLINAYGQVIGINSSKISSSYYSDTAVEGLCFAIPITHAKTVIDDLINYGYVRGKPLLGISGQNVDESLSQAFGIPVGVYVREVTPNGAADLAGVEVGDVIIAVNGKPVETYDEMNAEKNDYKAGDTITLTITRDGKDLTLPLTLQEKQPSDLH